MKKIEFGFSNDENPRGSWQGIGINDGTFLSEAEYYGSFGYDNNNYILVKVVKDEYRRNPELLDNFIVRKALCDLYQDGSAVLMLNQEKDMVCQQLENYFNNPQIKEKIHSIDDAIKLCQGTYKSPDSFILAELRDTVVATSIIPETFDRKNEAIKNCHMPISELQTALDNSMKR